jgi:hypothetical protein
VGKSLLKIRNTSYGKTLKPVATMSLKSNFATSDEKGKKKITNLCLTFTVTISHIGRISENKSPRTPSALGF